jgi:DNA replication protein DnaC
LFLLLEIFFLSKDGKGKIFRFQVNGHYVADSTGAGKTYLACALGQSACRNGVSVRYFQIAKLLQKITHARADGSSLKFLEILAKTQLLVIDDWLRNPLTESQTPDLLEILEDRYGRASTMLATQIPVSDWHDRLGNPTLSDAVMDRIIHNAYRLELKGESMRKRRSPLTHSGHKDI